MTGVIQSMPQFTVGEMVVYAKHGVGVIDKIVKMEFRGEDFLSYSIKMKATGIELFVPVSEAPTMGLRHLFRENEMEYALKIISSKEDIQELIHAKTWKERKKILDDLFKSGDPEALAKIVKFLFDKNNIKDLPNSERKVYEFALKFFIHELATVKKISEEEADHLISEALLAKES